MTTPTKPKAAKSGRDIDSGVHGNPVWRWVLYAAMVTFAIFFLFPLVYMLASSFKPDDQVLANSQSLEAFLPMCFTVGWRKFHSGYPQPVVFPGAVRFDYPTRQNGQPLFEVIAWYVIKIEPLAARVGSCKLL